MRNVFLFARREFLERVRTKAFLLTTILIPAFMFGVTVLPSLMMTRNGKENRHVVIVAADRKLGDAIARDLAERGKENGYTYNTDISTDTSDAQRNTLLQQTDHDQIQGYVWATPQAIDSGKVEYFTKSATDFEEIGNVQQAVGRGVRELRMSARGIKPDEIDALLKRVDIDAKKVKNGGVSSSGIEAFFLPFFMLMLMYMVVLIYGMSVLRSILEEKNSKIFEVLLSTATPKELMAGKILGVGAVGVVQMLIWIAFAVIGLGPGAAAAKATFHIPMPSISVMVYFAVFFVLGYVLYSTMCAALGAMVSSEQEAQQLQMPVMLPLILCVVFATAIIRQPNSTLSVVLSMIPFCTPLTMFLRISVAQPPMWQIWLSIALTIATIYAMLIVCAKIYRVGILMTGKRPTLPEIVKWVKYA
ncbi:MAG TPA: ABC transporter permease [Terriglobales bacterium]|jgi:ABC-2 type transport system permease protein